MNKRVVIVGGGFAGVKAALELCGDPRFQITLISSHSNFEYHAALYRSATGRSVLEVVLPLAEIFQGKSQVEIVEDTIESITAGKQMVTGRDGGSYFYDVLILAPGNVTAYYGIKGLAEYAYGVKSVHEALRLRRHLHDQLSDHRNIDKHYVVVGAGPSGIELAAELQSYLGRIYRKHKLAGKRFTVDVVEAAGTVLPSLPQLSPRVERRLKALGIHLDLNAPVKGETTDTLKLPHGDIKTHTVIWTAGVTGNPLFAAHPEIFKLAKGGRVAVNKNLEAVPNIYVLGDSADTTYSGMAQTALYDAVFVAKVLRGKKPRYQPAKPIAAIPVGPRWCAASTRLGTFYGYPGWIVRRWADLKLFLNLLPPSAALRTWLYGNKQDEWCPTCRQN